MTAIERANKVFQVCGYLVIRCWRGLDAPGVPSIIDSVPAGDIYPGQCIPGPLFVLAETDEADWAENFLVAWGRYPRPQEPENRYFRLVAE